jgi:hypothetical protein
MGCLKAFYTGGLLHGSLLHGRLIANEAYCTGGFLHGMLKTGCILFWMLFVWEANYGRESFDWVLFDLEAF